MHIGNGMFEPDEYPLVSLRRSKAEERSRPWWKNLMRMLCESGTSWCTFGWAEVTHGLRHCRTDPQD